VREQLLHKSIVIWVISSGLLVVVVTSSHCAVLHLKCAASAIYRELSQNTIYGKLGSHAHSPVFNANAPPPPPPSHESHANALSLSLFLSSSRAGVIVTLLLSFFLALKIRLNFLALFCLSAMFVDSFVSRFLLHRCRFFSSFFLFARGFFLKKLYLVVGVSRIQMRLV